MENKRRISVIVGLLIVLVGFYYFGFYKQGSDKGSSDLAEKEKTKYDEQKVIDDKIQKKSKDKAKKLLGKANVSFEEYKSVYKEKHINELREFNRKKTCSKRADNFGFSYIEFVFLQKTKEGNLQPYDVRNLGYRKAEALPNRGASLGSGDPSSIVRFAVVKNCKTDTDALVPGENYKFDKFEFHDEGYIGVNYLFEVPAEEKIDFVSPNSNREPEVYRFPILVNDIRKTIQSRLPEREEISLKIKNAVSSIPESKVGTIKDVIVGYKLGSTWIKEKGVSKNGIYNFGVNVSKGETPYGGAIKILGPFDWSDQSKSPYSSNVGFQLLMYKPGIKSKIIDMSKGLAYRHDPEKTVMKEFPIEHYIKNHDELTLSKYPDRQDPLQKPNVELKKTFARGGKTVTVFGAAAYKKNEKWHISVEALPGEYSLIIDRRMVDKNFSLTTKD